MLLKRLYEGRGKITLTCDYCSNSYEVFKAHVRSEAHFCSRKCQIAGRVKKPKQLIEYQCLECNKLKVVRKGRGGTYSYCSIKCMSAARGKQMSGANHPCWKGGVTDRPYNSKKWRAAVINRDQKCMECNAITDLTAHHVKPWKNHPELRYDLENGVTLCNDCHSKKHPELSSLFIKKISTLSIKQCPHCTEVFFQKRSKQIFCTKTCAIRYRVKQSKLITNGREKTMDSVSHHSKRSIH